VTARLRRGAVALLAVACFGVAARSQTPAEPSDRPPATALTADLDRIFDEPIFTRALVGARVESLTTGEVLYDRNGGRRVVPASNMKLVTLAVAAGRLGWDFRYETRLEAAGEVEDGVLWGDLIVVGSGDPSIGSLDEGPAPIFSEWIAALRDAGIRRVDGRLLGDDDVFEDEGRGAGWSWDHLTAGYAAPSGGLSYNQNVAVIRVRPADAENAPATIVVTPPGHGLAIEARVTTGPADSRARVSVRRDTGSRRLAVEGQVPAGGDPVLRTTAVDNPTRFFVDGLAAALADRGITIKGGSWDLDDVASARPAPTRRVIATHASPPLSVLAGHLMKASQNFYAETLLKTIGLAPSGTGSDEAGRQAIRETLADWGIPADALVVYDGSGLSRYNYVTAGAIVDLLTHVWLDDELRGPFMATLPVGGHDGTLQSRMTDPDLRRRVLAKTGTIANVRALSGYLDTTYGEKVVFSIIANHFTVPSAQVDEAVERALARVAQRPPPLVFRESSR
jgi:D-alanyl-D-alanine carboxypeptidase/D-alanyl-D-alanine-endopeptidase (penicillin-binding protein 4)